MSKVPDLLPCSAERLSGFPDSSSGMYYQDRMNQRVLYSWCRFFHFEALADPCPVTLSIICGHGYRVDKEEMRHR